ncbi:uncharacterized protein EAF01_005263 [Botrytis porri]|uniref:uncharacterized protein n=1 Tax=Botrytis porri TaxID=87229 RepID=UPI0019013851|nr:uncharacterized protein EAF01_005263 [Botrytis porri]KAF7907677.1 hypothetical protein EAF01_005263 [Botrytis porri]
MATSYHCPSYNKYATQYVTPAPQSDVTSQWSDTNSTTNLSETTSETISLTRSEIERLIHEDKERDRRHCDKWKQWAREQDAEDRLAFAVENARKEEDRCRLEALVDRQTWEYEKLKLEADRDRRVCLRKLKADEKWEAERQRREADRRGKGGSRTNPSRNDHPSREHTTRYVTGTSGRRLPYTPLSDEALIGIAKESEKRSKRRH